MTPPKFTDHDAACVIVEEDHSYFMILVREFFQTFSDRPIGDPSKTVSVTTAIFFDSGEEVDKAVADGVAAGGVDGRSRTSASCTSASSPIPTATSSSSATWTPRPPSRVPGPTRADGGGRARLRPVQRGHARPRAGGRAAAMLIVRDLHLGPRRYGELAAGSPASRATSSRRG